MKFSFSLFKKLAPSVKNPQDFAERFSLHAFEVEGVKGDTVEINIPANRYSDAASHLGIARLWTAIAGGSAERVRVQMKTMKSVHRGARVNVRIEDAPRCPCYSALFLEVRGVHESPQWLKDVLFACGLRPINAVVDIMNYVMLEVGQPLHAFDVDKLAHIKGKPEVIVRRARADERMTTLDGVELTLAGEDLLIADAKGPLALAGIKGGKRAEVGSETKHIVVEAANFDARSVYRTSRRLNLMTDAALRFGHGLSPVLVEWGVRRAAELLQEVCGGRVLEWVDAGARKLQPTVLKFEIDAFNRLTGLALKELSCLALLRRLGFSVRGKLVTAPPERLDISIPEDLFEEVVNLYGYENLPAAPPRVHLAPAQVDDTAQMKREAREVLAGFGLSEVYNYSFVSEREARDVSEGLAHAPVALQNPIAEDKAFLRPSLAPGLIGNLRDNLRFFDSVRIFEIGKVFWEANGKVQERLMLGIALAAKEGKKDGEPFSELKGFLEEFLEAMGIVEPFMPPHAFSLPFLNRGGSVRIESDHAALGYLGTLHGMRGAIAEIDLDELLKIEREENAFRPLPKHPAIIRDVSLLVDRDARIGEMMQAMEDADARHLENVELFDEYEDERLGEGKQSVTFRLVFRAEDRTLTDHEAGQELEKIVAALKEKFDAEVR